MEIKHCPNCGGEKIKVTGDNLYCTFCDVTLNITDGVALVTDTSPLADQNKRISKVEQDVDVLKTAAGHSQAEPIVEEPPPVATDDEPDDDDLDELEVME